MDCNIKQLEKTVNELICQYDNSDEVLKLISEMYIELDKDKFITVLNLKLFSVITERIKELNRLNYKSRSGQLKENERLNGLTILNKLLNKVFIDYKAILKDNDYSKEKILERKNLNRDSVLYPISDVYPVEYLPSSLFKELLDENSSFTFQYFKNLFDTNDSIKKLKSEIILFVDDLKNRLIEINRNIQRLAKSMHINDVDLKHIVQIEIDNNHYHIVVLEKLMLRLIESYDFLKSESGLSNSISVFGGKDFDKLEKFYNKFKVFLEPHVSFKVFSKIFILGENSEMRLNLVNGTLNDFGYLIHTLQTYFTEEIKKDYNQWWAENFTYNNSIKDKKGISTMKSNSIKDVSRRPSKLSTIKEIVETLN